MVTPIDPKRLHQVGSFTSPSLFTTKDEWLEVSRIENPDWPEESRLKYWDFCRARARQLH